MLMRSEWEPRDSRWLTGHDDEDAIGTQQRDHHRDRDNTMRQQQHDNMTRPRQRRRDQ